MSKLWRQLRTRLRLRARRQWLLGRAIRRRSALEPIADRSSAIGPDSILCFVTQRNEMVRLPFFFDYYRRLGIDHFLFVDNDSTDGSRDYLAAQPDVSLWLARGSYKAARFGMDWLQWLLFRYGAGHWCLTVDPDELLVYPHCDSRPLRALTDRLDNAALKSFSAMLLDLYPKGGISGQHYRAGQNPLEVACWFDPANYMIQKNPGYGNLWIQGGPRARMFFADDPAHAPALNKIPLVRWERPYVYVSSTHMMLPRSLNVVYEEDGGERGSGCLLHTKFLPHFVEKSVEELDRRQHYADSREYRAYHRLLRREPDFWTPESARYTNWRQLEELGLMSRGGWP